MQWLRTVLEQCVQPFSTAGVPRRSASDWPISVKAWNQDHKQVPGCQQDVSER